VVEAPSGAEAAGRLDHATHGDKCYKDLPTGTVKRADIGKSGETEADCECTEREYDAAHERPLT
jgi:hypothetical protein